MTNQLPLPLGRQLKEKGIQRAVDNAERVNPGWKEKCYELFKRFVVGQVKPFKVEAFREAVKEQLEEPPHLRAFAFVVVKAKKEGLIKHVGYTQVDNPTSHRANCSLWQRV